MVKAAIWVLAVILAAAAGWLDWRYRRIPNWLTVPGLVAGVVVNSLAGGWAGTKASLLGAALGLGILFPLVLLKSLGGGDWKLVGALGALLGPAGLIAVLVGAVFVAGFMALALVIYQGRVKQTLCNIGSILAAIFSLRLPGSEYTLDNPGAAKVPFGVAVALTVILYEANRVVRSLR